MKGSVIANILATLLVFSGAYGLWELFEFRLFDPVWLFGVLLSLTAGILLFLRIRLSEYLIYAYALYLVSWWAIFVYSMVEDGWPSDGYMDTIISLVPGILLITLCILSCIFVYRYFRTST